MWQVVQVMLLGKRTPRVIFSNVHALKAIIVVKVTAILPKVDSPKNRWHAYCQNPAPKLVSLCWEV